MLSIRRRQGFGGQAEFRWLNVSGFVFLRTLDPEDNSVRLDEKNKRDTQDKFPLCQSLPVQDRWSRPPSRKATAARQVEIGSLKLGFLFLPTKSNLHILYI